MVAAISIRHPCGMSGARMIGHALSKVNVVVLNIVGLYHVYGRWCMGHGSRLCFEAWV